MSGEEHSQRLDQLRTAFDRGFALPPAAAPEVPENLLTIRVAGERFALRAADLIGLQGRRRIVPLTGAAPELLGIAGVRGRLLPVYSLARLLGIAAADIDEGRWLALCGNADTALALAFSHFDGHRQPPRNSLLATPAGKSGSNLLEAVALDGATVPIVNPAALIRQIQRLYPQTT
jgi:purine-binding chemotaxis protein CheW